MLCLTKSIFALLTLFLRVNKICSQFKQLFIRLDLFYPYGATYTPNQTGKKHNKFPEETTNDKLVVLQQRNPAYGRHRVRRVFILFNAVPLRFRRALSLYTLCTAIALFWFSAKHLWTALTPFWLSTDYGHFDNRVRVWRLRQQTTSNNLKVWRFMGSLERMHDDNSGWIVNLSFAPPENICAWRHVCT